MIKTIICCDGCGKELSSIKEKYYIQLKTDKFLDAAGDTDYDYKDLVFCERCANDIKSALMKIANRK